MSLCRERFDFDRDAGVEHRAGYLVDLLSTGQAIDIGDFVPVRHRSDAKSKRGVIAYARIA